MKYTKTIEERLADGGLDRIGEFEERISTYPEKLRTHGGEKVQKAREIFEQRRRDKIDTILSP